MALSDYLDTVKTGGGTSSKKRKKMVNKREITPKSVTAKMLGKKPTEPTLRMSKIIKKKSK